MTPVIVCLTACALVSGVPVSASAQDAGRSVGTKGGYTFKTVGDVKIQADVYRPDDTTLRPVVVWIHGGALVTGNRSGVPRKILDLCKKDGYALVSIDYRL